MPSKLCFMNYDYTSQSWSLLWKVSLELGLVINNTSVVCFLLHMPNLVANHSKMSLDSFQWKLCLVSDNRKPTPLKAMLMNNDAIFHISCICCARSLKNVLWSLDLVLMVIFFMHVHWGRVDCHWDQLAYDRFSRSGSLQWLQNSSCLSPRSGKCSMCAL